jgi:hypothetical protein
MSSEEKADFLLNGRSINRADLDYFLYATRCDAITQFVREAWERTFKIRPDIEFSAAVWKNPMLNGRFIGQRWTDFAPWLDIVIPMNYREFFQGSFEDYLAYLEEMVKAQKRWCAGKSHPYAGIDAIYIFQEEKEPWDKMLALLDSPAMDDTAQAELRNLMEKNIRYLEKFSAPQARELRRLLKAFLENKVQKEKLIEFVKGILNDPPVGFYPEEKLLRTIETVRKAAAEGVVIFSAYHLTQKKLWPALEKAFDHPAKAPDKFLPITDSLSIQHIRSLKQK